MINLVSELPASIASLAMLLPVILDIIGVDRQLRLDDFKKQLLRILLDEPVVVHDDKIYQACERFLQIDGAAPDERRLALCRCSLREEMLSVRYLVVSNLIIELHNAKLSEPNTQQKIADQIYLARELFKFRLMDY